MRRFRSASKAADRPPGPAAELHGGGPNASDGDPEVTLSPTGEPETGRVTTIDEVVLSTTRWSAPDARAAVVLIHGFTSSSRDRAVVRQAEALLHAGFTVISYDGRGHAASEGSCTLGDLEALDVAAARTVITADRSIPPHLPVIVVGASMGAIAALRFAAANPDGLSAVVAISSPATWHVPRTARSLLASGLTQTRLGRLLCRRLLHTRLAPAWTNAEPPLSLVARITVPIALVHGESDRFLRSAEAVELYRSCRNPRRLDVVPGMGHAYHGLAVAPVVAAVEWALAASSRELIPA